MSLEQESFSILSNESQNAIAGIIHNKPHMFKRAYWEILLLNQINCDGERELVLIMALNSKTKVATTKTFNNLSEKTRDLSPTERYIFLSGIIDDISHAEKVFLIETNKEKYIPINENLPHAEVHILSYAQLQSLVGNLPSLDKI